MKTKTMKTKTMSGETDKGTEVSVGAEELTDIPAVSGVENAETQGTIDGLLDDASDKLNDFSVDEVKNQELSVDGMIERWVKGGKDRVAVQGELLTAVSGLLDNEKGSGKIIASFNKGQILQIMKLLGMRKEKDFATFIDKFVKSSSSHEVYHDQVNGKVQVIPKREEAPVVDETTEKGAMDLGEFVKSKGLTPQASMALMQISERFPDLSIMEHVQASWNIDQVELNESLKHLQSLNPDDIQKNIDGIKSFLENPFESEYYKNTIPFAKKHNKGLSAEKEAGMLIQEIARSDAMLKALRVPAGQIKAAEAPADEPLPAGEVVDEKSEMQKKAVESLRESPKLVDEIQNALIAVAYADNQIDITHDNSMIVENHDGEEYLVVDPSRASGEILQILSPMNNESLSSEGKQYFLLTDDLMTALNIANPNVTTLKAKDVKKEDFSSADIKYDTEKEEYERNVHYNEKTKEHGMVIGFPKGTLAHGAEESIAYQGVGDDVVGKILENVDESSLDMTKVYQMVQPLDETLLNMVSYSGAGSLEVRGKFENGMLNITVENEGVLPLIPNDENNTRESWNNTMTSLTTQEHNAAYYARQRYLGGADDNYGGLGNLFWIDIIKNMKESNNKKIQAGDNSSLEQMQVQRVGNKNVYTFKFDLRKEPESTPQSETTELQPEEFVGETIAPEPEQPTEENLEDMGITIEPEPEKPADDSELPEGGVQIKPE